MGGADDDEGYKQPALTPLQRIDTFREQGFLRLPLLSQESCQKLREYVLADLEAALLQPEKELRFSAIRKRTNRWDLKLEASPIVRSAMHEILLCDNYLDSILAPLCRCDDAKDVVLAELGSVISHPGAPAQEWHADSAHTGSELTDCICCFVTLQDTPLTMGPTEILPDTHTGAFHKSAVANFPPKGLMPAYASPKSMQAGYRHAGDACLMDARLYHRGGANVGTENDNDDCRRLVFYFTIRSRNAPHPGGFLFTIMEELNGMQLVQFLENEQQEEETNNI